MKHLETPEIVEFVTGKSGRKQALKAKQHIDACPECSLRVKAHHYIRENFDQVWTDWTSSRRLPGESLADRVSLALSQGLENPQHPDLKKRMESWLKRVRADAGIAWCAAVGSVAKAVKVVREQLDELPPLALDSALRPVAVPASGVQTSGAVETGSRRAVHTNSRLKPLRTRGAEKPLPTLSVEKTKHKGILCISVKSPLLDKPWPLVMLVPEAGGEPEVGQFRETQDGLMAEFKDLPKADYLVVVEGRAGRKASPPKPRAPRRI